MFLKYSIYIKPDKFIVGYTQKTAVFAHRIVVKNQNGQIVFVPPLHSTDSTLPPSPFPRPASVRSSLSLGGDDWASGDILGCAFAGFFAGE
jgi:hypothetical protein